MTTGFSTAATWLQNVAGHDNVAETEKKDVHNDPVLRDLRAMKDQETKDEIHNPPPPKHGYNTRSGGRNPANNGASHILNQPKPKFVSHKAPTHGKREKAPKASNRLGGDHMA